MNSVIILLVGDNSLGPVLVKDDDLLSLNKQKQVLKYLLHEGNPDHKYPDGTPAPIPPGGFMINLDHVIAISVAPQ